MPTFRADVEIHTDEIARQIATNKRLEDVHEFIMLVVEFVADYSFTKSLINELQESLKREDKTCT